MLQKLGEPWAFLVQLTHGGVVEFKEHPGKTRSRRGSDFAAGRSVTSRVLQSVYSLAAVAFIFYLNYWNLLGFRY